MSNLIARIMKHAIPALAASALVIAGWSEPLRESSEVWAQPVLPAPTNVSVARGSVLGEAVISWDPVPEAAFYRIGWSAAPDFSAAIDEGRYWRETYTYVNVVNQGQSSHTVTRLTPGTFYLFTMGTISSRHAVPRWAEPSGADEISLAHDPSGESDIGSIAIEVPLDPSSDAYYQIGWIAFADYDAAVAEGRDWREVFNFVEVRNYGQAAHTVPRLTPGVRYAFNVTVKDSLGGIPQWADQWQVRAPEPEPQGSALPEPATATVCPAPGFPAAVVPERPPKGAPGDYDGDDDGLIEVANLQQLDAIRYDLQGAGTPTDRQLYDAAFPDANPGMGCPEDGCTGYELVADLDFDANGNGEHDSEDPFWNDGAGWLPIGDGSNPFAADFDGGGHTISHLHVSRPQSSDIGLFGSHYPPGARSVEIRHVGLVSIIVVGMDNVGGLVGKGSRVLRSYASGLVLGRNNVGGLVGEGGTIRGSCAEAFVGGTSSVGGLLGHGSVVEGSYVVDYMDSPGGVSGNRSVGGLVGSVPYSGSVRKSYSTVGVSGGSEVGGLVGSGWGAGGSPNANNTSGRGSAAGRLGEAINISYARHTYPHPGSISDSYATGEVRGDGDNIGGLLGRGAPGNISNSHATGAVTGYSYGDNLGGLVGKFDSDRGEDVPTWAVVYGEINNSYSTGSVTGRENNNVGGLVGLSEGRIRASYATGRVVGDDDNVGGLVGLNRSYLTASYATGEVVSHEDNVGGLVGHNSGYIYSSYATGDVSGITSVGGLAGFSASLIHSSYSTGRASGADLVGGLVGVNSGSVSYSYWDVDASGNQHSNGGLGKTTAELQEPTAYTGIYANWNLNNDDLWEFGASNEYPALKYGGLSVADQRAGQPRRRSRRQVRLRRVQPQTECSGCLAVRHNGFVRRA
ncbi:MAG: fibronectin type III domain-containing protein [Chloroflexi bacterium]|nr:fibronectin type III domain-containing protein [Chloroflexota bacterium]